MYPRRAKLPANHNPHNYGVATVSRIDKIKESCEEYSLFYRALLQRRPVI